MTTDPIPMFPLGSVLFPHMPLPLQIFEERYLKLLGHALDSDDPQFGVVLIERGHEVGGGEQRFDVGTLARVVEVDPRAGTTGVLAIGTNRLTVVEWLPDDPFPRAVIETVPEFSWSARWDPLLRETETEVRNLLRAAGDLAAGQVRSLWQPDVAVDEDPVKASWQLAAITPVGPLDHFDLLRAATCEELLEGTGRLARDAHETLSLLRDHPPQ